MTEWDEAAWTRCESYIAGTSRADFEGAPDHGDWLGEHGCPWLVMDGRATEALMNAGQDLDPVPDLPSYAPPPSYGPVHVRGYFRRDGTYVRPHTRRSPH